MAQVPVNSSALVDVVDPTMCGVVRCFPLETRIEVVSDIRILDGVVCASNREECHQCGTEKRVSITSTHVGKDRIWAGRVSRI